MNQTLLRTGFTTGTCAAVAAKAAAVMLLTGESVNQMQLVTPNQTSVVMKIERPWVLKKDGMAGCAVIKDAGDDPDVTNGVLVYAQVRLLQPEELVQIPKEWYGDQGIYLTGGEGIGRVTRPGLSCPVGKAAINPVPRQMIFDAVSQVLLENRKSNNVLITISIPEGKELAEKTFNPKLGIIGGISVLGTSGVVEPMSEPALLAAIRLEIHMKRMEGKRFLAIAPGNYGQSLLQEQLQISLTHAVKCSNFMADTMDILASEGVEQILMAGHIGKLIKVAGGIRNTHSRYGDNRMIILDDFAKRVIPAEIREQFNLKSFILESNTTEEALGYLQRAGYMELVSRQIVREIQTQLDSWSKGKVKTQVVTFSNDYGILGMTEGAKALIQELNKAERDEEV